MLTLMMYKLCITLKHRTQTLSYCSHQLHFHSSTEVRTTSVYIQYLCLIHVLTWRADNSTISQMRTLVNIRPSITAIQNRGLCPSTSYVIQKHWTCPLSKGIEDSNSYCREKYTVFIYTVPETSVMTARHWRQNFSCRLCCIQQRQSLAGTCIKW